MQKLAKETFNNDFLFDVRIYSQLSNIELKMQNIDDQKINKYVKEKLPMKKDFLEMYK